MNNSFKRIIEKYKSLDKKHKGYVIVILLIVLVMGWAFISAGVITGSFNRAQLKNNANNEKVNALGLIITETKDGQKYFEIYGENGNYNNTENIAMLNNVVGNFYKDNEVSMSFQSSKGSYNEKSGVITLYENTYIILKDATSLKADKLVWSGSDNETIAEGNVVIQKSNKMLVTADKCIIGPNYEKFKIIGNSQTKIYDN